VLLVLITLVAAVLYCRNQNKEPEPVMHKPFLAPTRPAVSNPAYDTGKHTSNTLYKSGRAKKGSKRDAAMGPSAP
jgi:hypothetical protein